MKFKVNDKNIQAGGTSLMGEIDCSYDILCMKFGNPEKGDGYKTDAEWKIRFEDGDTVATIYNYKDGHSYCGADGLDTKDIRDWHIGGHNHDAVKLVKLELGIA